jgi:putative cell wall-binding protein
LLGYRRGFQDCAFGLSHLATTTSLMEARVTTATRRLRRTGVAGFAAAVTAGAVLIGTATSAFALTVTTFRVDPASAATTVNPGDAADAVAATQLSIPNTAGNITIGSTIVLKLEGAGVNPGTTNAGVGFVTAPTITVSGPFTTSFGTTAGSTTDVTPTFTSVLGSSAGAATTAGIKDEDTITFTNSNAGTVGDFYTLEIAGQTVKVGSAAVNGAVQLHPYAADGGASLAAAVTVATVSNVKITSPEVSAAPSSTGVALSPVTLTEVTAGAVIGTGSNTFTLTLSGAGTPQFTAAVTPTITVPSGYADTAPATTASNVYTFTVTGPATPVAATVTVSGLTVNLTAVGTGVVTLTAARTLPTAAAVGAVPVIGVLTTARTGGTDRYATAAQLFTQNAFTGGTNHVAVIASGANYPDALSANYLAAGLNAGAGTRVLLTDPNVLPQPTQQALITGAIATVYIVGGPSAVSANVSNAIAAMHVSNNNANAFINVIRVSGADRYATNNQVDLFNGASAVTTAVVAVGSNFADALAIAPVVVTKKFPLVLTNGPSLSPSAQSTLVNLGIKNVIIVGGTSAVSAATEASIKALGITIAYRIAGADRTQTAADIATYETTLTSAAAFAATTSYAALNGLGLNIAQVYIARGDGFADALAAGTVAGGVGSSAIGAILLTGDPNTLGAGIPAYLGGKSANVTTLTVLGLTSAVSVATASAAVASIS